MTLACESRERGWWQQYGEAVPEWFATYVGLEAEASTISAYQAETLTFIKDEWSVFVAGVKAGAFRLERRLKK